MHPGVRSAFLSDEHVHPGGAAAAAPLGLSYGGGLPQRVYISVDMIEALAAKYQFVDDIDGDLELMAAPVEATPLVSTPGPVPPAVALADLLESEDSRERSVAARTLEHISLAAV